MLADVDYFVELPDGTTAILEIKTTNYNAKDNWWLDGEETIPAYYESQGRHYMAVMDVDRCFFCCLYGNNEQESIIRDMQRDLAYEDEMIFPGTGFLGKPCAYQNTAALHRGWRPRDRERAPVHRPR